MLDYIYRNGNIYFISSERVSGKRHYLRCTPQQPDTATATGRGTDGKVRHMDAVGKALQQIERDSRRSFHRHARSLAFSFSDQDIEITCMGHETAVPDHFFHGGKPSSGDVVKMLMSARKELARLGDETGVLETTAKIWKVCLDRKDRRQQYRMAAE